MSQRNIKTVIIYLRTPSNSEARVASHENLILSRVTVNDSTHHTFASHNRDPNALDSDGKKYQS